MDSSDLKPPADPIPLVGTIALMATTVAGFFILVGPTGFPTDAILTRFALSASQPWNLAGYWMLHLGLFHLVSNLVGLLAIGLVLEKVLGSSDYWLIFGLGAATSGIVYLVVSPSASLAGASGGIAALIAASMMVKPLETIRNLAVGAVLVALILQPLLVLTVENSLHSIQRQKDSLQPQIEQAHQNNRPTQERQLQEQFNQLDSSQKTIQTSALQDYYKPAIWLPHAIGALAGSLFILRFRPKAIQPTLNAIHGYLGKKEKK